jgi:hypothetical protein
MITPQIYASAWISITATLLLMAKWIREKLGLMYFDFIDRVDGKNGDLGLDRSVDVADIARDYLLPLGSNDAIETYAKNNGLPKGYYLEKLRKGVGRPIGLILLATVFTFSMVFAFLGPVLYHFSGFSYAPEYLVIVYILVGTTVSLYLIF